MSKMGNYVLEMQELLDDDYLYQEHEFDHYDTQTTYTDCTTLPPDVKQKLVKAGLDEWYVLDDIPF